MLSHLRASSRTYPNGVCTGKRAHTRTGYVRRTYPNGVCTVLLAYIPERVMYTVHTRPVCTGGARTYPTGMYTVHTRPVCTGEARTYPIGMYTVHTRPVCTVLLSFANVMFANGSAYIPDRYVHRTYPTGMYRGSAYIPDRYVHRTYQKVCTVLLSFANLMFANGECP